MFDSSPIIAATAAAGRGVGLLPAAMFTSELAAERLVQPFPLELDAGSYWITRLNSKPDNPAMAAFRGWLSRSTNE